MFRPCVTEPVRIRTTFSIEAASGVSTVNEVPYCMRFGAAVIVGRGPLCRYGGEKISEVCSFGISEPSSRPEPASRMRPSGSSIDVLWYPRGRWLDAIDFHVSVSGCQISGSSTAVDVTSLPFGVRVPPMASTSPVGSTVSVWKVRFHFIDATSCHAGTV
jgi:hypothetical protein